MVLKELIYMHEESIIILGVSYYAYQSQVKILSFRVAGLAHIIATRGVA